MELLDKIVNTATTMAVALFLAVVVVFLCRQLRDFEREDRELSRRALSGQEKPE